MTRAHFCAFPIFLHRSVCCAGSFVAGALLLHRLYCCTIDNIAPALLMRRWFCCAGPDLALALFSCWCCSCASAVVVLALFLHWRRTLHLSHIARISQATIMEHMVCECCTSLGHCFLRTSINRTLVPAWGSDIQPYGMQLFVQRSGIGSKLDSTILHKKRNFITVVGL